MQTYTEFKKEAELGGAGDYFQRREEELALADMAGYRDGTSKQYPGSWTKDPDSEYWMLDRTKVPFNYPEQFWNKMDVINKKYNGNLYSGFRKTEGMPQGRGINDKQMGYKMLVPQEPFTMSVTSYKNQMNKDWDEHLERIRNSTASDNIESTSSYMTRRWGKDWMDNPYPQQSTQESTPMTKTQSYNDFSKQAADEQAPWYTGIQDWIKENPNLAAGGTALLAAAPLYLLGRGFGKKRDRLLGLLTAVAGGGAAFYGMKNWGVPWLAGLGQEAATNTPEQKSTGKTVAPPFTEAEQDAANAAREARGQRKAPVVLRYDENNKPVFRGLEPARQRKRPWFFSTKSYLDEMNEENSRPISQEMQEYANALRKERGQKAAPVTMGYTPNGRPLIKK